MLMKNNGSSVPIDRLNSFTYSICSAPGLALSVKGLVMVGDAQDMERGVLVLPSASLVRYLPVQAVPQGITTPDLIVDVADGDRMLTTLHFCTIWHHKRRDCHVVAWERVSFATLQSALQYNTVRFQVCTCGRLHKSSCHLDAQPRKECLMGILETSGLAMCVSGGYVYLVACHETDHLPVGDLFHGVIYRYAIWPTRGLQTCSKYQFVHLSSCVEYLTERDISLDVGWQGVEACPALVWHGVVSCEMS